MEWAHSEWAALLSTQPHSTAQHGRPTTCRLSGSARLPSPAAYCQAERLTHPHSTLAATPPLPTGVPPACCRQQAVGGTAAPAPRSNSHPLMPAPVHFPPSPASDCSSADYCSLAFSQLFHGPEALARAADARPQLSQSDCPRSAQPACLTMFHCHPPSCPPGLRPCQTHVRLVSSHTYPTLAPQMRNTRPAPCRSVPRPAILCYVSAHTALPQLL